MAAGAACIALPHAEGAISILGSTPDDGSEKPSEKTADDLYKLMKYRRTSRDFRRDEVDPETIDRILDAVSAVPTGGNNNRLEFSVIYTRDAMRRLYRAVYGGQQLDFLSDGDEDDLSELRIYDAPHLFIAHTKVGDRFRDGDFVEISMATAYFELLANAMGLGTVISTYSAELLSKNEEAMRLLQIPKDHRFMTVVGFGYPKYRYARGIRKTRPIHRIK